MSRMRFVVRNNSGSRDQSDVGIEDSGVAPPSEVWRARRWPPCFSMMVRQNREIHSHSVRLVVKTSLAYVRASDAEISRARFSR